MTRHPKKAFELTTRTGGERPPIHILANESDLIANLALTVEQRQPVVSAMLLEEIERGELHHPHTLPHDAVRLGCWVRFLDERSGNKRSVQLVLPVAANIAEGRISILTPVGAALYGLRTGDEIEWPDIDGNARRITIIDVMQPGTNGPS